MSYEIAIESQLTNMLKSHYYDSAMKFLLPLIIQLLVIQTTISSPVFDAIQDGQATVSQSPNTTTINQTSSATTITWNSFNVQANEQVIFNQPSTTAIAINHILDSNPSQIFGSISANGRIILLNPQGFYFGANSSVSANTFIAATTSLTNTIYNPTTNTLTIINPTILNNSIQALGQISTSKTQLIAKTITQQGT
ncbi:MAG: filamentous hemagglutinin N-terminal domain-containing protein, partial [Methylacidiphilales bacterium]|nr:filamentous hemagglutinin N-terminal domain-containing protein [Candidatus Methylacidiphilales bacterium]